MNSLAKVQKGEKVDVNDGSKCSHGAITVGKTSTKPKNDCPLMDNQKNQQMVVSPKEITKVQKLLELKRDLWKYNRVHVHQQTR
jgi:hypothetical protein